VISVADIFVWSVVIFSIVVLGFGARKFWSFRLRQREARASSAEREYF